MDEPTHWYLDGPGSWSVGCLSILVNLTLLAVFLRDLKNVSTMGNVYGYLIAINGILVTVMSQSIFFTRHVKPWQDSESLVKIRDFALGKYLGVIYLNDSLSQVVKII